MKKRYFAIGLVSTMVTYQLLAHPFDPSFSDIMNEVYRTDQLSLAWNRREQKAGGVKKEV